MINAFLTHLDNIPRDPGDVYWPEFEAREIGRAEQALRDLVIGSNLRRREHFLRCVQLTYLVANSPFADAITAEDPRLTYSKDGLRDLFRLSGATITAYGNPTVPRLVFGTKAGTPNVARWDLSIDSYTTLSPSEGSGQVRYSDDVGAIALLDFDYDRTNDVSSVIELPNDQGVVTFYGDPDTTHRWTINYQGDLDSWVSATFHRVPTLDPSGVLSPALLKQFKSAPLLIDKLAAIAAGLGGYAP